MRITHTITFSGTALASLLLSAVFTTNAQAQSVQPLMPADSDQTASGMSTPGPDQAPAGQAAAKTATASAGNWNIDATLYLWFPGTHGNANALGYNLGFKASAADLLSHFRFGIMGMGDMRYKRLILTSDILFLTLSGDNTKTLRLPSQPQIASEFVFREVIFTQKVGFRLIDSEKIHVDGLTGIRFWHMGQTLTLTPTLPNSGDIYGSRNWVDPLVGARIQVPLSPKMMFTFGGDVGGWGAGSQLDYQIGGGLAYKIKPRLALEAGWRYLYLDYAQNNNSTQLTFNGPVMALTYSFQKAH